MGAIKLGYSTFGLTELDFLDAITAVDRAGYAGVEIAFHRDQFNPFELGEDDLAWIRRELDSLRVKAACVATAPYFFDPQRPHEPSLLAVERAARKRRIDLVKRGIHVARALGVSLVTFGSGFVRDEHMANPQADPGELLVDSIHECLREIRDDEDITLLIEPEPGMHIETLADAMRLMHQVDSPKFKLHVDLCHAYCSEPNYPVALAHAAPETRYLHISDAHQGYNLKIVQDAENLTCKLDFTNLLVHFPDTADYLLLDRAHPIHFRDQRPTRTRVVHIDALLARAGIRQALRVVDYASLPASLSGLDDELFTWMISNPGLSYDVLERARPIAAYLRQTGSPPVADRMMANTHTGIAHYHEIPGEGTLDFAACFKALTTNGFSGYGTVELYHHIGTWQKALTASYRQLAPFAAATRTGRMRRSR